MRCGEAHDEPDHRGNFHSGGILNQIPKGNIMAAKAKAKTKKPAPKKKVAAKKKK
jgi:hypothetical protein